MAALPVAALALSAAGTGISAFGAAEGGEAKGAAAAYQSQVAANNAAIAKQNEELEVQSGEVASANQEMKTRAIVGSTKAGEGASGVDVNSKSFTNVRGGEAELGELDALTIRSNAARRAYNYAVQATSDTAESQLLGTESKQDVIGGDISALGTFVGGMGSVGQKYAMYQNFGANAGTNGVQFPPDDTFGP